MNQLGNREIIEYGDGTEKIIIFSDVDLHDFKIFTVGADFLNGDVNFTRDVLLSTTYLEYATHIAEGIPAEVMYFITDDLTEHLYLLGSSETDGRIILIQWEQVH
jgi:hypothetical protein